jgi:hypothetical protein
MNAAPQAKTEIRERFIDAVMELSITDDEGVTAWNLITDAWRVIEVASARGDCPPCPNREEWLAALRVAIFRAKHPETGRGE